eukprot:9778680-Alexandrium_andersonii.AAC.1
MPFQGSTASLPLPQGIRPKFCLLFAAKMQEAFRDVDIWRRSVAEASGRRPSHLAAVETRAR